MQSAEKNIYLLLLSDFALLNVAFFVMNFIKRGTPVLTPTYVKLLLAFYFFWMVIAFFSDKFDCKIRRRYWEGILVNLKTTAVMVYLLAIMIIMLGLPGFSRIQLFSTCLIYFLLECAGFSFHYALAKKQGASQPSNSRHKPLQTTNGKFSIFRLFNEFLIISFCFFALNYLERGTFSLSPDYEKILLVIYGLWLLTSVFTRKFEIVHCRNFFYFIAPYIKSFFLMVAVMAVIVFAFRLFYLSRLQIFGTFCLLLFMETIYNSLYFFDVNNHTGIRALVTPNLRRQRNKSTRLSELADWQCQPNKSRTTTYDKSKGYVLQCSPELLQLIQNRIDLYRIDPKNIKTLNATCCQNMNGRHKVRLLINSYRLNDIRRINKYFLEVHAKIKMGSYLVGNFQPSEVYQKQFFTRYPRRIASLLYWIAFVFVRAVPKLPYLKRLYFFITKGRNRVISNAEVLGRLSYCGFKIIALDKIDDKFYFIAQKVNQPSQDPNPSYGPMIKLKRIGLDGRTIYINKLRTMHPYSEYLQDYVFKTNGLNSNGKLNHDFRVSKWGRVFRRLWIDELPQVINFFQGDLRLFGVRALSPHYFFLYPKELQEWRIKYKPGLIPPYYADLPKSFDEIIKSERRYLRQKQQRPFVTDVKYFSKALHNIILKKARSN